MASRNSACFCACGAPAWISSKGAFRRSAKCQAAASTPTIRGEVVIAAATCLIRGNDLMIFKICAHPTTALAPNTAAFAQRLKSSRELFFHRDLDAPVLRAAFGIIAAVRIHVRHERLFFAEAFGGDVSCGQASLLHQPSFHGHRALF